MAVRENELKKHHNRLVTLRSADIKNIIIGPNQSINIRCRIYNELNYQPTRAIVTEASNANLPSYIDMTPAVVHYDNSIVDVIVNLSNLTTNTVNIAPRASIAELSR